MENAGPIEFTPGQFLTLHLREEGATPRHYTVTSKKGDPFLQCCVKYTQDGLVSDALHAMPEGDVVGLAAPFGTFAIKEKSAVLVLISAGIGVTPMKSFLSSHPDQIAFAKEEFANAVASMSAGHRLRRWWSTCSLT